MTNCGQVHMKFLVSGWYFSFIGFVIFILITCIQSDLKSFLHFWSSQKWPILFNTTSSVKNQPLHVSKHARFDKDTGMWKLIKHAWQYDLQEKKEVNAIIGAALVSATTPSDVQEDACTLPRLTAKSWQLG